MREHRTVAGAAVRVLVLQLARHADQHVLPVALRTLIEQDDPAPTAAPHEVQAGARG